MLDHQRVHSIQKLINQLQAETAGVSKAKTVLIRLRDQAHDDTPALRTKDGLKEMHEELAKNRDLIKDSINYVNKNREAIDDATLARLNERILLKETGSAVDPIQSLQALSRQELAYAYDALLDCIQQREGLIEQRLKAQIQHYGISERIFFEGKDWARENEDMKDPFNPFNDNVLAEEVMSVTEQINNVHNYKNMSAEQKAYDLIARRFNPFLEPNFNPEQVVNANNDVFTHEERVPRESPNPNHAPTVNRENFKGYIYSDEVAKEAVEGYVSELREKFDMPFDELFHKEKRLVDAVVKATEALHRKEATLPNPMGADRIFSTSELKKEYYAKELQSEHQFSIDQR